MIGYSKKNREIVRENAFNEKKKRPGLKFNPGLALIGLRTTGPVAYYLPFTFWISSDPVVYCVILVYAFSMY